MRFYTVTIHGEANQWPSNEDDSSGMSATSGVIFPVYTDRNSGHGLFPENKLLIDDDSVFGTGWISNDLLTCPSGGAILLSWGKQHDASAPAGKVSSQGDTDFAVIVTRASVAFDDLCMRHYQLIPEVQRESPPADRDLPDDPRLPAAVFLRVIDNTLWSTGGFWEPKAEDDQDEDMDEPDEVDPEAVDMDDSKITTSPEVDTFGRQCAVLLAGQVIVYRLPIPPDRRKTEDEYVRVVIKFDGSEIHSECWVGDFEASCWDCTPDPDHVIP